MIPDYVFKNIINNPYLPDPRLASPLTQVRLSSYYDPTANGEYSKGRDHDFIGWKQALILCWARDYMVKTPAIVKLTIPKDAEVVFTKHKCRASYAKVEAIYPCDPLFTENTEPLDEPFAISYHDYKFRYTPGEKVFPDEFDRNPNAVCSHGIHFFRHYGEAYDY